MSRIPQDAPCVIDRDSIMLWNFYKTKKLAQESCAKLNKKNEAHYLVATYADYVSMQEVLHAQC